MTGELGQGREVGGAGGADAEAVRAGNAGTEVGGAGGAGAGASASAQPSTTQQPAQQRKTAEDLARAEALKAYLRAENEDDDGYDPYSDRPAAVEPLFERDPWS